MKKADFEAHFYTREYLKALCENPGYPRFAYDDENQKDGTLSYFADVTQPFPEALLQLLLNVGRERVKIMDHFGVDTQIVSLSAPGLEQLPSPIGTASIWSALMISDDQALPRIRSHQVFSRFRSASTTFPLVLISVTLIAPRSKNILAKLATECRTPAA